MFKIIFKIAFIDKLTFHPGIATKSVFFVKKIISLVGLAFVMRVPRPFSTPKALFESTFIGTAIVPNVETDSLWQPIDVVSFVVVAVNETFFAFAMFEPIFETAFIKVPIGLLVESPSIR